MTRWTKEGLVTILGLLLVSEASAQGNGKRNGKMQSPAEKAEKSLACLKEKPDLRFIENANNVCKDKLPYEADDKSWMRKLIVCTWEQLGIVKGNTFFEKVLKSVTQTIFPTQVGVDMGVVLNDLCVKRFPENIKNLTSADNCQSYEPLIDCLILRSQEFCAGKWVATKG